MDEDHAARGGPIWDTFLGGPSDTGTLKLLVLIAVFVVTGGVIFWALP